MTNELSPFEEELEKHGKFVYYNVGISMMPLLRQNNDLIIIEKKGEKINKYDVVLFKRDNKYILHRVIKVNEDNTYDIVGDNQWRIERSVKDSQILGVMKAYVKDGKEISVNDEEYLNYVDDLFNKPFYIKRMTIIIRDYKNRIIRKWKQIKEHLNG